MLFFLITVQRDTRKQSLTSFFYHVCYLYMPHSITQEAWYVWKCFTFLCCKNRCQVWCDKGLNSISVLWFLITFLGEGFTYRLASLLDNEMFLL